MLREYILNIYSDLTINYYRNIILSIYYIYIVAGEHKTDHFMMEKWLKKISFYSNFTINTKIQYL